MTSLDPAVRDLLAAIHETLNASDSYSVCAAQTAIRSAVKHGDLDADWLDHCHQAADTLRVRRADRWDAYQDSRELPA